MKTTHGIFLIDNLGKLLVVHPTNSPKYFWSIPKGLGEKNETSFETASRELLEETTLDIKSILIDSMRLYLNLGYSAYPNGKKALKAFLIVSNSNLSEIYKDLKCNSIFINKNGEEIQENDIVRWVDFNEISQKLHASQRKFIKSIKVFIDE